MTATERWLGAKASIRRPCQHVCSASVSEQIIDGDQWVAERLKFLRERLAEDPPGPERRAIEAEIEVLSKERGIASGRLRRTRIGWRPRRKSTRHG